MADAADSKSVGRKPVKVRLLSPAPPLAPTGTIQKISGMSLIVARLGSWGALRPRVVAHAIAFPARDSATPMPATILVVDDQELVRRTLCSFLAQRPDWQVYEAENGRVALNRIPEIQPDLVVLDIVMPEMNGMEAAYRIRELAPAPKIILISSHYVPEEAITIARIFGDGNFIAKSETGKSLVPAIRRLLPQARQAKAMA